MMQSITGPRRYLWVKESDFSSRTPYGQPVDFTPPSLSGDRVENRWHVRTSHTIGLHTLIHRLSTLRRGNCGGFGKVFNNRII